MGRDRDVDSPSGRERHRRSDHSPSDEEDSGGDSRARRRRQRSRPMAEPKDRDNAARERRHRRNSGHRRSRSRSRERDEQSRRRHRERKDRDRSRSHDRSRHRRRSRSPPPKKRRRSRDDHDDDGERPVPHQRSRAPLPSQNDAFKGPQAITEGEALSPADKQKPNFKPTGLLAKEANTVAGTTTVLKYHEPPEARKPPAKEAWRMYVFKGKDLVDTIHLHERSAWLFGRDAKVTDFLLEHPSVSKQHAVVQFRHITGRNEFGDRLSKVKPYLIDLESANGTVMNGERVQASRYVELVDGDVVRFGESEREYVMMLPPP